jgi:hypothetical protein
MAGRGPRPKDPSRRARTNKDPHGMRIVQSEPVKQPPLPDEMPDTRPWPEQTRVWWDMWRDDPLSAELRATDWADLLDTAVIHGLFWWGDAKLAGEPRLRVAKHGATQEDRARVANHLCGGG